MALRTSLHPQAVMLYKANLWKSPPGGHLAAGKASREQGSLASRICRGGLSHVVEAQAASPTVSVSDYHPGWILRIGRSLESQLVTDPKHAFLLLHEKS